MLYSPSFKFSITLHLFIVLPILFQEIYIYSFYWMQRILKVFTFTEQQKITLSKTIMRNIKFTRAVCSLGALAVALLWLWTLLLTYTLILDPLQCRLTAAHLISQILRMTPSPLKHTQFIKTFIFHPLQRSVYCKQTQYPHSRTFWFWHPCFLRKLASRCTTNNRPTDAKL